MKKNMQRARRRQKIMNMRRRKVNYLSHCHVQHRLALQDSAAAVTVQEEDSLQNF